MTQPRRQFMYAPRSLLLTTLALCLGPGGAWAPADEPTRLRILSYNIHHGRGTDGKIDLERVARIIRNVQPDLVSLQEVDRDTDRSGKVDQPKQIAELTGLQPIFERNIPFQGGDYGNAVLSRLPPKRHKNHPLPSHYQGEQRGVLEVELELSDKQPMLFFATHLDYRPNDSERLASAKMIEELVKERSDVPAILAGDLNATPTSETLKLFERSWRLAAANSPLATFPSSKPQRQIDYILFRPHDRWRVVETRVLDEPVASDHRPIFTILELQRGD